MLFDVKQSGRKPFSAQLLAALTMKFPVLAQDKVLVICPRQDQVNDNFTTDM